VLCLKCRDDVVTAEKLIMSSHQPPLYPAWSIALSKNPDQHQNLPNHLIDEKSPYLRQHAHNPVDWYPWGDAAFLRAAAEQKPVFLSIGYATCHWCHVMARESFEDEHIASLLNAHFIAVKVDREERPDIDTMYMTACQRMTGQGGWPLTIIMTPDKKPFFAGTYFPPTSRAGMTGLTDILVKVNQLWQDQRETLTNAAEQLTNLLKESFQVSIEGTADKTLLSIGYQELAASFDPVNGGFGRAPKFPTPVILLFLLRYWKRTGSGQALFMVEKTLEAIRCGGIHDHLGGGFHRYSTDATWRVPHFEKMLYDQALLLMVFTEAWLATKKPLYRETSEAIITYILRDLISPEGAFISAEDADSPGGEGAFYLWTRKDLDAVLGPEDGQYAARLFHVTPGGNYPSAESDAGENILYLLPGNPENSGDMAHRQSVQSRLFAVRQRRPHPRRDEKILTDWNGLMIAALAQASRAFDNSGYCSAARRAMLFILNHVKSDNGGLLHRWCDGEAAIPAFADDYAFVIHALLELYGTTFDTVWLEESLQLNRYLSEHFSDPQGRGFFTTSDAGDILIARRKEVYDGVVPSANSVMLRNLVLLGHLTGNPLYEEQAGLLAEGLSGVIRQSPSAYSAFLCGLDHLLGPASDIVVSGETSGTVEHEMVRLIRDTYLPSVTLQVRHPLQQTTAILDALAPFTRTMTVRDGKTTAYVCTGRTCSEPVTTADALRDLISEKK
jgi:uncharacterized protein